MMMQPAQTPVEEEEKEERNSFSAAQSKKQASASRERNGRIYRGASLKSSDIEELQSKVAIVSSKLPDSIKKDRSHTRGSSVNISPQAVPPLENRRSAATSGPPAPQSFNLAPYDQISIPKLSFQQDAAQPAQTRLLNKFAEKRPDVPGHDSSWARQPANVLLA
jgi:hypothetical protein